MKKYLLPLALAATLASPVVLAQDCTIDLDSSDQMRFDKSAITVTSSCKEITVRLRHSGKLPVNAMGHNVVITQTDVYQAVAQDGVKAGLANHYVPANDKRVIAFTKLIGGGETTSIKFPGTRLTAGGDYTFFCSFPGHWTLMVGKLKVE